MADEVATDGLRYNGKTLTAVTLLPGKNDRRLAILGHLITNKNFFGMAHRRIKKDWFADQKLSKVYQFLCLQFDEIGFHPNVIELKNYTGFIKEGNDEKIALWRTIDEALKWAGIIRLETLQQELTDWLHSKIFQESMLKAAKAWNAGNWQEVGRLFEGAAKEYRETTFDQPVAVSWDNTPEFLTRTQQGTAEAITTGCYLLDRALLDREENKLKPETGTTRLNSKGLQKGDTTVILAPVNTGKTTTLVTMANFAMRHGFRVLFMTHEGRPDDIKLKFLKALLNKSQDEIYELLVQQPEVIRSAEQLLKNMLTYVPYNHAGMTVEEVVALIRRLQDDCVAKHSGTNRPGGYDLLVVDYPALLTTEKANGGHMSPRHIQDLVYQYYVQLALEYNWHSLLAIQTNREGSKINSGSRDDRGNNDHRFLMMEDVAEAWGPMQSASNVITLNRSPSSKAKNRMTYYVAKSRSSETGVAVTVETNFRNSLSHTPWGKAVCYRGDYTLENTIDGHLVNLNNDEIPRHQVVEDSK